MSANLTEFELHELDGMTSRIVLQGRLDAAAAGRLDASFAAAVEAADRHALLDLRKLDFVGSLGLRMFIAAARTLQRRGRKMAMFGATTAVKEVFEVVALGDLVPTFRTEDEARAWLAT